MNTEQIEAQLNELIGQSVWLSCKTPAGWIMQVGGKLQLIPRDGDGGTVCFRVFQDFVGITFTADMVRSVKVLPTSSKWYLVDLKENAWEQTIGSEV